VASPFVIVDVDGPQGTREVRVTNPDRVYFPASGATKLDIVNYYLSVADGIVRALYERPCMLHRHPDGVEGEKIYQKRLPKGAPDWVQTAEVSFPSGRTADELCVTEVAAVAWAVQMSTVEFHPWHTRCAAVEMPDELRIDLDPQPGTDFADAREVALTAVRETLDELGWTGWPKTSGNRGVHVYVRIEPRWGFTEVRRAALALARAIERRRPDLVTTKWWKEERGANVFVDYNQNAKDRTIASAYSLRARPDATVSAPVTWEELPAVETEDFTLATMPSRFAELGDVHAGIDDTAYSLEPLLRLWEELPGGELNFPPDYPKMPGEPPRVQPSKKVAEHWDQDGNRIEA
jgi:DNA ligase D